MTARALRDTSSNAMKISHTSPPPLRRRRPRRRRRQRRRSRRRRGHRHRRRRVGPSRPFAIVSF